ncbi:hypothetical protein [Spirillospora sp. CA-294931]|uniref:hypothetical protein n=1 Tax=Spirillospora sp. CA-294931 TaxID=3240042 RepID=UPI003D89F3E6
MTTTPCTVTTGFFVLGRCGRAAVQQCPQCGRAICGTHVGSHGLCPECVVAAGYGSHDPHAPGWVSGYRRWFYQRSSQSYNDTIWYSSFDSYDRGTFNPGDDYYSSGGDDFGGDDSGFVDS